MTAIEILLALKQLSNIVLTEKLYSKVIDKEMQNCYNSCAFEEEALSGSLRVMPKWMQEKHSSVFNKEIG